MQLFKSIYTLLPALMLLALCACASVDSGSEWKNVNYDMSHYTVGYLGPSGSIGP